MKNPIIAALDLESAADARALVRRLDGAVNFYKVGMELYAAAGMDLVRGLLADGNQVFLDMKYYDIPETVKRATARVAETGVTFLTVHASLAVMRAAVEGKAGSALRVLGVTVLTSVDDADLRDDGYQCDVGSLVDLRVANAGRAGLDGIVCSPLEVARVRRLAGPAMELVTPGVRSAGAASGDQKRVATPAEAMRDGANWLVVGREITRAADPASAVRRILDSLSA